jgi:hypothetical protein
VDIMHVTEYLWDASLAFHAEDRSEREQWVSERLLEVLRGRASLVAGGIRRSGTRRRVRGKERKLVDKCADYLIKYKRYLRFDDYLARGFPIATGVVEGACRHLVCDRMDVGARWSLAGAEAVLRLRALRSSGDFEQYWTYHEQQEYRRNHAVRYAGDEPPPLPRFPFQSEAHQVTALTRLARPSRSCSKRATPKWLWHTSNQAMPSTRVTARSRRARHLGCPSGVA